MSAGVRALALLLVAGCARSSGGDDPVAASVRAGIAAQLGIAPGRVVCADDRCLAEVGGLPVPIAVAGGAEATWQTDEIVVIAPLVAHVTAELAELGLTARVDCGPPVQPVPADGRLACRLDDGGVAWVRLAGDRIDVEVALTPEVVAARTAPIDEADLERQSRALDSDEAEGDAEPTDDQDEAEGDAGVDAPLPHGVGG